MDVVRELIHNEAENVLNNSACIFSTPVRVVEDLGDELYIIETIATQSKYTVHNYSGSPVEIGENVLLYFKGSVISSKSAYIGASLNKNSGGGGGSDTRHAKIIYIESDNSLRVLSQEETKISEIGFKTLDKTTISLVFNAVVESNQIGTATFKVYVDNAAIDYIPVDNVNNGYTHCTFNVPLSFTEEEIADHTIEINAVGVGEVTAIKCFVHGQSIELMDEYLTDENDYIYEVFADHSETWFYIGTKKRIIMPLTLEGQPVTIVHATTFTDKDITSVRIPEGIQIIE